MKREREEKEEQLLTLYWLSVAGVAGVDEVRTTAVMLNVGVEVLVVVELVL